MTEKVLDDEYRYSESGMYYSPLAGSYSSVMAYINDLPKNPDPEVFGLHGNAEIVNSQN